MQQVGTRGGQETALRACARVVHPFENQEVWREAH